MAIIEPIPVDILNKEKFQTRLDLARKLMVPDTLFIQIMAHAPGYGEALFDAMFQSHAIGNVDHSLKEIIRIRLTTISKDSTSFLFSMVDCSGQVHPTELHK